MLDDERDFELKFLAAPLNELDKSKCATRRAHFHLFKFGRCNTEDWQDKTEAVPGEDNSSEDIDTESGASKGHGGIVPAIGESERKETRPIELFYDLFLVANITLFSQAHDIDDVDTLASYVGFFSLLWFTWLNLALFTIRFGKDCVMERLFMGLQLGGMVGFAVIAPGFFPAFTSPVWSIFKATSLILMGTRLVLALQYLSIAWLARDQKHVRDPLLIIAGSTALAATIYGALTATFIEHRHYHAYMAWFIIGGLEAIVNIFVTSEWKLLSFRGTHLVDRMSLLTLIILGEGMIQLFETLNMLTSNPMAFSSATAGNIVSIVVIYYFLYMLYFDKIKKKYFGLIREQIWAFLHFGLHVSLILVVSGVNQFFTIIKAQDVGEVYADRILQLGPGWGNLNSTLAFQNYAQGVKGIVDSFTNTYMQTTTIPPDWINIVQSNITDLANFNYTAYSINPNAANQYLNSLQDYIQSYMFAVLLNAYSFDENLGDDTFYEAADSIVTKAETVYCFSLLFIALLFYIRHSYNVTLSIRSWLSIATHVVFGITLCLLTTLITSITSTNSESNFLFSDWCLPLVAIFYFVCVCVDMATSYHWQDLWSKSKKKEEAKLSGD